MSTTDDERHPTRLAIVGTDLKFISPLIDRVRSEPLFEIRIDEWPTFRAHDEDQTRAALGWADVIVCEWAGPNAVLASQLKRPEQRLVVRLHRMELDHPEWRDIEVSNVDLVVTVGPFYRRRVLEMTGWPADKVVVIPNSVDLAAFDRPKSEAAIHRLGMIGAASSRKRLDRALDTLTMLRETDQRFHLSVKGSDPWSLKWVTDRPDEVAFFEEIRNRLDSEPLLAGAVSFEPPGADVPQWLETIGFILSTSDDESFHLSPAEGMASRAVPVILPWPGADEIYDQRWIAANEVDMAQRISELAADPIKWASTGAAARTEIASRYSLDDALSRWTYHAIRPQPVRPPGALRVSAVSGSSAVADPSVRALAQTLNAVGHRVTVITRGAPKPPIAPEVDIVTPPPTTRFSPNWFRRRFGDADAVDARQLRTLLEASRPDLVYPHREEDTGITSGLEFPIVRNPSWDAKDNDFIAIAPSSPSLSVSPTAVADPPTQTADWPAYTPSPGRWDGKRVAIAYRVTPTSPGRYLESALRRAGFEIAVFDGSLDWDQVDPRTTFVVIVESPMPSIQIAGTKKVVPTLFWVHHGEHHVDANLRLTYRYEADAVLMAHSWHLAHRFPVPTFRFPFAVAPEMVSTSRPWRDRTLDVAMVGAGIGKEGGRYDSRRAMIDTVQRATDIASEFAYGLQPQEMMALYSDSRIVLNEGGPRHFPITMRVFEALGSGAVLLTEDIPGTATLIGRNHHYVPMENDLVAQIRELLTSGETETIASEGRDWAAERHTYDHRVDQLMELANNLTPITIDNPFPPLTPLGCLIENDVDAQQIAVFGDVAPLGLGDRAVRIGDPARLGDRSIDGVVIGRGPIPGLRAAVCAARGYVYADQPHVEEVSRILSEERPEADVTVEGGLLRADIGGTPYRMRPPDHPLSS